MPDNFVIAIPIYDQVDLLDVAAPKEVFQWMSERWKERRARIFLVAELDKPVTTRDGTTILPDKTFDEVPRVDLLWVPGGEPSALTREMRNRAFTRFLVDRSAQAEYVTSVCEGALLAANAGLFDGYEVTTHWAFIPCLKSYPRVEIAPGNPRFVQDRNRITGGGISSGLDEALHIVKLLCGEAIAEQVQLTIQYFPDPPVHAEIPPVTGCPVQGLPIQGG